MSVNEKTTMPTPGKDEVQVPRKEIVERAYQVRRLIESKLGKRKRQASRVTVGPSLLAETIAQNIALCAIVHIEKESLPDDPRVRAAVEIEVHEMIQKWMRERAAAAGRPEIYDSDGKLVNAAPVKEEPEPQPCVVCGVESLGLCEEHQPRVCVVSKGQLASHVGDIVRLTTDEKIKVISVDGEVADIRRAEHGYGEISWSRKGRMWAGTPCLHFTQEAI